MADEGRPGSKRAGDQAQRYRDAIDKIRQRTDYTSKGLATIGTAAITAIGYAKLADLFPSDGPCWAYAALILGVVAMAAAVIVLFCRFDKASQSVFTSADLDETYKRNQIDEEDDDKDERELIAKVYGDAAKLQGLKTLVAYQARGERFERIADLSGEKRGKELRDRADQIFAEIGAAQDRAAALLLRDRARKAVYGTTTLVMIVLFIVGWYGTAAGADALQSERKDKIELAESCAKARETKGVVKSELPSICGTEEADKPADKASPRKVSRDGFKGLREALEKCVETAEKNKEEPTACAPLEAALKAAPPRDGGTGSG